MRMSHLILSDIGPFRGTHTIDLTAEGEQNGFAFFGQNGRGKTLHLQRHEVVPLGRGKDQGQSVYGREAAIEEEANRRSIRRHTDEQGGLRERRPAGDVCDAPSRGARGGIQVSRTARSSSKMPRSDKHIEVVLTVTIGEDSFSGLEGQEQIERFFLRSWRGSSSSTERHWRNTPTCPRRTRPLV